MNIDISVIPSTATITRIVLVSHEQWDIPEAKQAVFADIKMPDGDTGTIRIGWTDSDDPSDGQCMLANCFEALSKRTIVKTVIPVNPQDPESDPQEQPSVPLFPMTAREAEIIPCDILIMQVRLWWREQGRPSVFEMDPAVYAAYREAVGLKYPGSQKEHVEQADDNYGNIVRIRARFEASDPTPESVPTTLSDTVTQILESVERIAGCTRPEEMLNWLEAWEMTRREAAQKGPTTLVQDIAAAINKHSAENGSNTPDWVLANYLVGCLEAFDSAVTARKKWRGPMEKKA